MPISGGEIKIPARLLKAGAALALWGRQGAQCHILFPNRWHLVWKLYMGRAQALQADRHARHEIQLEAAARLLQHHEEQTTTPYIPADDGFVFSSQEIESYIRLQRRKSLAFHACHTRAA